MKVGITGAAGLIGTHVHAYFHGVEGVEVVPADIAEFATADLRRTFVRDCDVVVHLAGQNRGDDDELYRTNVGLAEQLIEACETENVQPHVIFSSSVHIYRETAYGRSKRECSRLLAAWADRSGACFTNLVLPNVFGEGGRPFYNSAVSTFCHQLAVGEEPTIIQDATIELVHAQQVAAKVHAVLSEGTTGDVVMTGVKMTVSEVLATLQHMATLYGEFVVPDLRERFDAYLFNTYRSYLFPSAYLMTPELHADARGHLFEAVRTLNGGQAFFSTTRPGITRGNHYHLRKFERFCVIRGEAVIRLRKLFSDEVHEYAVSGERPQFIDMPTLYTHDITNTGRDDLITAFWSSEFFDKADPDTFAEDVLQ